MYRRNLFIYVVVHNSIMIGRIRLYVVKNASQAIHREADLSLISLQVEPQMNPASSFRVISISLVHRES